MIIPGFRFAAAAAGLKKAGGLDVALMVADRPVAAAGVYTTNRVKAAPVLLCRERLRRGQAQAILVNSGNANACTGPQGLADARETTRLAAQLLELPEPLVLAASTGVIGQPLPVSKIAQVLPGLTVSLKPDGLPEVAQAIMTTDTRPKMAFLEEQLNGQRIVLAGVAKGAGMIHPDMATMLSFVFTDAAVHPKLLKILLQKAVATSFNRITIDGDTSTNDTVLLLAGGAAGNPPIEEMGPAMDFLEAILTHLLRVLAQQIVADGEGASRAYRIVVLGAASAADALKAARTVAGSPLVKTAMAGADVNWGRIMAALGRSGARFDPDKTDISFGPHAVVQQGVGLGTAAEAQAQKLIKTGSFTVTIHLHAGDFADHYDTCDLTEDYIRINASYRS